MIKDVKAPSISTTLVALDQHFYDMVRLYEKGVFPKVLLLNGKKGIGKFTLVFHFLNYIYSKKEQTSYSYKEKLIDINSYFYNSILNKTCLDVLFIQAEEGKHIKIDDIRKLKAILSKSSLSDKPRFIIIDEVEFFNINSVNALLKTLEEPGQNNYFILINNQQANLIETISSRCLKNNIFLSTLQRNKIIDYIAVNQNINFIIDNVEHLTPGLALIYNELFNKHKINNDENIYFKLSKLLHAYKKDKNKDLIGMSIFFIDQFFYRLVNENVNKIDFLLNLKSIILNKINDFIVYNLNINSVLLSIELKLKNAK